MSYPKKLYLHGDTSGPSITVMDAEEHHRYQHSGFHDLYIEVETVEQPETEAPKRRGRPPKVD